MRFLTRQTVATGHEQDSPSAFTRAGIVGRLAMYNERVIEARAKSMEMLKNRADTLTFRRVDNVLTMRNIEGFGQPKRMASGFLMMSMAHASLGLGLGLGVANDVGIALGTILSSFASLGALGASALMTITHHNQQKNLSLKESV